MTYTRLYIIRRLCRLTGEPIPAPRCDRTIDMFGEE